MTTKSPYSNVTDITFDLETCALCPTAAVMSIGAVAWNRDGGATPFITLHSGEIDPVTVFSAHVDLRGMFVDGFTFDAKTAEWWGKQSEAAKSLLLAADLDGSACSPIEDVVKWFCGWILEMKKAAGRDDINIWCQGTDFDAAILRNICHKYGIVDFLSHHRLRDHRTYYYECANMLCEAGGVEFDPKTAYAFVDEYTEAGGVKHGPVFDCKRSIYSTWQIRNHIICLFPHNRQACP